MRIDELVSKLTKWPGNAKVFIKVNEYEEDHLRQLKVTEVEMPTDGEVSDHCMLFAG